MRREQANLAWLKAALNTARLAGDRAVVLAFHSNPFDEKLRYDNGPFEPLYAELSVATHSEVKP